MDQSNPTGQTAAPSTTPSNQGTSPTNNNPFEASPPESQNQTVETPSQTTQPGVETQQPQGDPTAAQPGQQPAAAPAFNPQDFTKSVVESVLAAQQALQQQQAPQTQQPQQAPMTPEQFRQHYQIPQVDAGAYEAIFGVAPDKPERVAALDGILQGYMRAGVLMGQDLLKAQLGQFESRFTGQISPLLAAHQQAQEAAIVNEFQTANPDLKDYMSVVTEVRDAMIARGTKFSSKEEMFKKVGEATRQVLTRVRGTGAPASQQPSSVPNSSKPRTMTPASTGGRGGSASSTPKSTAEAIFGT